MTRLLATVIGNASEAVESEVKAVARALRRAVATTGRQVQTELRAQARAAGFKDGGKAVANTWRLKTYPPPGVGPRSWRPAATIYSNMPVAVEAFDQGAIVKTRSGKFLAWPTGYNATRGRRNAGARGGVKVTTAQMAAMGKKRPRESFVIRARSNPNVYLWCMKVYEGRGLSRRSRIKLFGGSGDEVFTGNRKGRAARARELAKQGFVPMFFLKKTVILRKRLNIEQVRAQAGGWFATNALAELAALGE